MNFGQRMALERREENRKLRDRVWNAVKKDTHLRVWNFTVSDEIKGAIRTLDTMGYKCEVEYDGATGKVHLVAVKYRPA